MDLSSNFAGFEDWERRSKRALDHQHDYVLPVLRGQLNALLRREKNTDLDSYLKSLHSHAVDAYKRSVVPDEVSRKGEEALEKIKKVTRVFVIQTFTQPFPST